MWGIMGGGASLLGTVIRVRGGVRVRVRIGRWTYIRGMCSGSRRRVQSSGEWIREQCDRNRPSRTG